MINQLPAESADLQCAFFARRRVVLPKAGASGVLQEGRSYCFLAKACAGVLVCSLHRVWDRTGRLVVTIRHINNPASRGVVGLAATVAIACGDLVGGVCWADVAASAADDVGLSEITITAEK
jgi:hypothetical protein